MPPWQRPGAGCEGPGVLPVPSARRTRVLLGNLEPVVLLGMDRVLTREGMDVVVGSDPDDLVDQVIRVEPDAVVLGLDELSSRELGERVQSASPGTKVILWARDEDVMEVLDTENGLSRPRRVPLPAASPEELCSELRDHHPVVEE